MGLAATVLGFSSLGFVTRCWQLAIERRHVFDNFYGHFIAAGAFGGVGYYVHGIEIHQRLALEKRKEALLQNRERAAELAAAAAAESAPAH